jgi:hypothetical protein
MSGSSIAMPFIDGWQHASTLHPGHVMHMLCAATSAISTAISEKPQPHFAFLLHYLAFSPNCYPQTPNSQSITRITVRLLRLSSS